ncbi:MAG: dTMP kinase [Steroidobacteraceae bacterium]
MRGRFITFEGIEGAGKSTVVHGVAASLRDRGLEVLVTREPGGTPLAEQIRQLVLAHGDEPLDSVAETLLMFAGRSIHLRNRIEPALEAGTWVLCDRFSDASRAYQGAGRGVDEDLIEQLVRSVQRGLEPDLTFLLDLPVRMGLQRAASRRQARDRFESQNLAFFERVRTGYLQLAAREQRIRIIDATVSAEQVLAAVGRELESLL